MQVHSRHGFACLPVTAIHAINFGKSTLVLSNTGSSIAIKCIDGERDLLVRRVFESQTIYGISSCVVKSIDNVAEFQLVIWGGSKICFCTLTSVNPPLSVGSPGLSLKIGEQKDVGDWIMTVLTDSYQSDPVLLTAHNAIWSIELQADLKLFPRLIAQGMNTLLYSADITFANNDNILVASGTIFGEVIFWTCSRSYEASDWTCRTEHVFIGHVGSVFGVTLSRPLSIHGQTYRLLASCSDDRTIRIWDVSDHDNTNAYKSNEGAALTGTGFSAERVQSLQIATVWGHLSRIWGVTFSGAEVSADTNTMTLISRGEDAVCKQWSLSVDDLINKSNSQTSLLKALKSDRHHAGKNIWSMTTTVQEEISNILTGGADGRIVSRSFNEMNGSFQDSISFREIFEILPQVLGRALKQYVVFSSGAVVATTDSGNLIRTSAGCMNQWAIVAESPSRAPIILCSNSSHSMTFYSFSDGSLHAYDVSENRVISTEFRLPSQASWMRIVQSEWTPATKHQIFLLANLHGDQQPVLCIINLTNLRMDVQSFVLQTPPDFMITSAVYDIASSFLICGSRAGALAVFDTFNRSSGIIDACECVRHVHGRDSVLSIVMVPQHLNVLRAECAYVLTTGRDGTFAIHRVKKKASNNRNVYLKTVHRSQPPLGPSIEGAYFVTSPALGHALLLYGFKSKDFVVWDETNQHTLLAIDCGGMHRSWNYSPTKNGTGTFVWTKAGTFNLYRELRSRNGIVQLGGHGREIKALAMTTLSVSDVRSGPGATSEVLLATGAEDTEIRLWRHSSTSSRCQVVLRSHTTGLQALSFSPCSQYLFSSGGVEEFLVWRLNTVPVLSVGAVMVSQLAKTEDDADARIMGFDVTNLSTEKFGSSKFLIVMAYSNGKAKVVQFEHHEDHEKGHLALTCQFNIGTQCLTQASFLSTARSRSIIVGATDGHLRFVRIESDNEEISSHRVHQSNIATMAVRKLNNSISLVVTGGDDNALGLTILSTGDRVPPLQKLLIQKAHAAALTAVALVVDEATMKVYIVSAGNDQTVRLWRVVNGAGSSNGNTIPQTEIACGLRTSNINIQKVSECFTNVADISNMQIISQARGTDGGLDIEVVIVGVGIQTIHLKIEL